MSSTVVSPRTMHRARLQADLLAHYDELIARTSWGREQIRDHQRDRLRALLRHAATRSRFHAARLGGVDVDSIEPDDLSALPVMTKRDLMEHFDDVVTDPRISHADAEAALAGADGEPAMLGDETLVLASGGSSGPRGVFVLDPPACRQFFGSLSRGLVARIRATGAPPGGVRAAMVAAGSPVHATGVAAWLTGDGGLPFTFVPVPVTLPIADVVDRLNVIRPQLLYGYPTMLAQLGVEQRDGRLRIAPAMVTSTSETLEPALRASIRAAFGVPVIDAFGSTEQLVGSTPPDEEVLVFAEDGCIVELVDAEDRPVPPGTRSTAVLITTLENRLQPLIRYRLTDSFAQQPPVDGHGYLRARVDGRADEVLRFGDVVVHPLVVRSVLARAADVVDYRVRQTPRGIAVTILSTGEPDTADLRALLTDALVTAGLTDPEVAVEVVTDLPRDVHSGKRRRFVPLG